MCYIFVKSGVQELPCEYVKAMRSLGNRDGAGVMWVEDGRVKIEKCMAYTEDEMVALYERHANHDLMVMHLRNQSIGPRTLNNVHPYWVLNQEWGDPVDIALMHNGTISGLQVDTSLSDSGNFAAYFLRPLLRKKLGLWSSHEFWHMVSALIGNSKLVLMHNSGEVRIVNAGLGRTLENGIWVSSRAPLRPLKMPDVTPLPVEVASTNPAPLTPGEIEWVEESDGKQHLRVVNGIQLTPPEPADDALQLPINNVIGELA